MKIIHKIEVDKNKKEYLEKYGLENDSKSYIIFEK